MFAVVMFLLSFTIFFLVRGNSLFVFFPVVFITQNCCFFHDHVVVLVELDIMPNLIGNPFHALEV